MKFNLKGYYGGVFFEIRLHPAISIEEYEYIQFSSPEARKAILDFYKEEMQQGQRIDGANLGRRFIEQTGYFEITRTRPSWEGFKREVNPFVLYSFETEDGVVLLTPHKIQTNDAIGRAEIRILKL